MAVSPEQCYVGGEPAATSCTTCQRPICSEHTRMGQPFIAASELLRTAVRSPALLAGPPLDQVPYCPGCREELAGRRTTEQLKVMMGLLALIILLGVVIYLIAV